MTDHTNAGSNIYASRESRPVPTNKRTLSPIEAMTDAEVDALLEAAEDEYVERFPEPQERTYHAHGSMEPHIHFHRSGDGHNHRSPVVHE